MQERNGNHMAHTIKRYPNRKLYDSQAKRYVTLDNVAQLVREGVEVKIIDNPTGNDITEMVLSKALAELLSETKATDEKNKVPASVLAEIIQRRSDAVVDYFKQGLAASARAVKDVEEQIQQGLKGMRRRTVDATSTATSTAEDFKTAVNRMIEESVHFLIHKMNLPSRAEIVTLNERIAELEAALKTKNGNGNGNGNGAHPKPRTRKKKLERSN